MLADWLPLLLFAPFIGSFLGVLILRLPAGRPVAWSRSACDSCGRALAWTEMLPLASYAALGGRCRGCGAGIGAFHWRIELAALAVAAWVVAVDGGGPAAWADCTLGWGLLALAWIDWEHQRLPDAITLPLILLGLVATWWLDPARMLDHALGAAAGYVAFRVIALLYRAWRGREGLGHGDAKLLAVAGAWVGWQGLDQVVLLGALASIGLALWRLRGQGLSGGVAVPFGPGLALALLVIRLHG